MNGLRACRRLGGFRASLNLSHRIFYDSPTRNRITRITTPTTKPLFAIRRFSNTILKMAETKEQKWNALVVRKTFLEFFEGKGHTIGRLAG